MADITQGKYYAYYFLDDSTDSSPNSYRSVARRKTDLMPTIPSSRDPNFGSRSSLYCHTPRTQGKQKNLQKQTNKQSNVNLQKATNLNKYVIICNCARIQCG